jgi:mono/diheme cytochrome c family protein
MAMSFRSVMAAVVAAGIMGSGAALAQQTPPAGDAGRGKQLYDADGCFECHGYVGQGSRMSGPRVAPMDMPYEFFVHRIRFPSNEMPPYAVAALPDADLADIYAFLRSIPRPQQAAKDIPLLNR